MKSKIATWCLLVASQVVLLGGQCMAQVLVSDKKVLDFGNTFENGSDSLAVTISNPSLSTVQVKTIRKYKIYGANDFSAKDTAFTLVAGASKQIYVKFSPRHNITYLSQLVILDNANRGNVVIELKGQGKYSKTYYNATENLSEEALKTAMKTLLAQNYVTLGYTIGRDRMFLMIDNLKVNGQGASVNTIIDRYVAKTISGFNTRTEAQNFPDGSCTSVCYNTEHTWPQSLFSQNDPMVSDLHHLYVVNEPANSIRSNYPFGNVSSPTWSVGGSKFANGVFEPRDDQKGATARSMLYFPIRHQNYSSYLNSQEAVLRQWHAAFPPTIRDVRRNEDIFTYQKNRNPFVDYPQFIERITSISNTSALVASYKIDTIGSQVAYGTVSDTAFRIFSYPIINTSNQSISVSGISLLHGNSIELLPSTIPSSILPGGKAHIHIRVKWPQADHSFTDSLLFSWSGTSMQSVHVKVSGMVQFPVMTSSEREMMELAPRISPNPSGGRFFVEIGSEGKLTISDVMGHPIEAPLIYDAIGCHVDMSATETGVYFINVTKSSKNYILKLVIN